MSRRREFRNTFEFGEISEDFLRRSDTDAMRQSCRKLRNMCLNAGGSAFRRPGTGEVVIAAGEARLFKFKGRNGTEDLIFTNGRVDIYDAAGSLVQSITSSCSWVTADLERLQFAVDAEKVFVGHSSFQPQVLTRAAAGTWTIANYAFQTGVSGNLAQPFYDKFSDISVTMGLSAYTGTGVTMTFSDDVLVAGHVGTRFRYLTRNEIEITGYTSATQATVTIHDELYPTLDVTVADSSGFKVDEVIESTISLLQGQVVSLPNATTVRVLMLSGYDQFEVIVTAGLDKDKIVGSEATQEVTGVAVVGTPATTGIWDEQLLSSVRGYPSAILIHRDRLFMAGFSEATNVIVASATGNLFDFSIAADDDAAFNVEMGDDPNAELRHMVSAEQLLLFTDRGVYYVPESLDNPITPTNMGFFKIAPDGSSYAEPAITTDGAMFVDQDAGRLMLVAPTGNTRNSWAVGELSEAAYHLMNSPVRLAVANGFDGRAERYAFIVNGDGTMAVMMNRRGSGNVGFALWSHGTGTWTDVVADEDDVTVISKIGSAYRMSDFSFDYLTDDQAAYASAVSGRDGDTCEVVNTKVVVTSGVVGATTTGELDEQAPAAGTALGYDFATQLQPAPGILQGKGWVRQRVPTSHVEVYQSGAFYVDGAGSWPYDADDDLETVGQITDRVFRVHKLGWEVAPSPSITQPKGEGALLEVRAVTMEVAS